MGSLEVRWGLIIGGAGLIWLYLSYFLGLHTRGILLLQITGLVGILISVAGYIFGLRAIHLGWPENTWFESVLSGMRMAGAVTVITVIAQLGYLYWIHPGWTDMMVEETISHFAEQGVSGEDLKEYREGARVTFGVGMNLFQAALGSLFVGSLTTVIVTAILKRRQG